jgi:hypothetical protein
MYAQINREPTTTTADVQRDEETRKEHPEHRLKTTVPKVVKMIREKVEARISLATQIAVLGESSMLQFTFRAYCSP